MVAVKKPNPPPSTANGLTPPPSKCNMPLLEESILRFWKDNASFAKTLQQSEGRPLFTFNEGPPTANGKPGLHHVLARTFKDIYPRYKTMQGFYCPRKAGWDTHGLPVEHEVEKALGIFDKKEIETKIGVAKFTKLCRESVMRYIGEWERMTERMGFWVDMQHAYYTLHNDYIESVWHLLKVIFDKGLIERQYRVIPYDPMVGATLSSHEVAQGYKEIKDPAVTVRFTLKNPGQKVSFLAWTTTPWTLPANVALTVNPNIEYAEVECEGERLILARTLLQNVLGERPWKEIRRMAGKTLEGLYYERPFNYLSQKDSKGEVLGKVILGDFVGEEDGTGVVHSAPAYGAEDLAACLPHRLPVLHGVGLDGKFYPAVKPVAGMFFKDADPILIQLLQEKGLLFHHETITHNYPHGWRTGTPLIYYAKEAWHIRTTAIKERMVELNRKIHWYPSHIRDGRFGNWLENNVDWALSRERFWGTPLPIWEDEDGNSVCVGSLKELEGLCGHSLKGVDLHRPAIDAISFANPKTGKPMQRVPEVIDCWFDSGAMSYAQWHYPFENKALFEQHFPADYICEAIDQTRGWFYTLHAIAALVSDSVGFRNVVCLSHIVDQHGRKMSKSQGNIIDPYTVFNQCGADPLRWHFLARVSPDGQKRISVNIVQAVLTGFINTYWNAHAFFITYACIDNPRLDDELPPSELSDMDRWVLALLQQTVQSSSAALDDYNAKGAGESIEYFVDALSNWYIRRNRRRFWKAENNADKRAAYYTLYTSLKTITLLVAPFMPFLSEAVFQNLVRKVQANSPQSVHMASWPKPVETLKNPGLLVEVEAVRKAVHLGRSAREASGIRVRQPLRRLLLRSANPAQKAAVLKHQHQVQEELNVQTIAFLDDDAQLVEHVIKPNFAVLGKRLGKRMPLLKQALAQISPQQAALHTKTLHAGESIHISVGDELVRLQREDLVLESQSPPGRSCIEDDGWLAALDTELDDRLLQEGLLREVVRSVQEARKQAGLQVEERIVLKVEGHAQIDALLAVHKPKLMYETLAEQWGQAEQKFLHNSEHTLGKVKWRLFLQRHSQHPLDEKKHKKGGGNSA